MLNFAGNALKFTREGSVTIRARRETPQPGDSAVPTGGSR